MIIKINRTSTERIKPLCHVTMVANFWISTQPCGLSCKYGINQRKKMTCMTFLCIIAYINKAVTKQDTGTTQQQNDQTSHCGAPESTREWGILVLVM